MRWCLPVLACAAACSAESRCDPEADVGCAPELACALVASAPECVTPVVVRGKVSDGATGAPVAGARVTAVAEDGAPLAAAATTIFDGSYEIRLGVPRDAGGLPLSRRLRVRASAPGFGSFPDAWRDWPVSDASAARPTQQQDKLVLAAAATDVQLVAFAGGPGRGEISGVVELPPGGGAVLVVAESEESVGGRPRGTAAWVDRDGAYRIVGLPPAVLRVRAYAKGESYREERIGLDAGEITTLDLRLDRGTPAASVSGTASGAATVALVVASTWEPAIAAGEEPPGLRASPAAAGTYGISGVPAGRYRVVSREADGVVPLDDAPEIVVAGGEVAVPGALRLAEALAVVSPGAGGPEGLRQPPALAWRPHAAAARYRVEVWNLAGLRVFEREVAAADAIAYMGPLVRGQVYRFEARALDAGGALLSRTDDRRGVFFSLAE
jgi:hypothetical protein